MDTDAERKLLAGYISEHLEATGSTVAKAMLGSWATTVPHFVKVMPFDYQRVLEASALLQIAADAQKNAGEEKKLSI